MRACAAGLLAAALSLPPCAALAEPDITASFDTPAEPSEYHGDWPVWKRIVVTISRTAGSDEGMFKGWSKFKWEIVPDEGGFFLGNSPEVADVNGDGTPELVAVQYLPSSGWRMAAFEPPLPDLGILGEAAFSAGVDQAVLLGVIDAGSDDGALIGVIVTEKGENRLLIYSFQDNKPKTLPVTYGYSAGPAGPEPRVRNCQDQSVFLVANDKDGTVTAIGRRGDSEVVRVWNSSIPATRAGFAKAASCG